MVPTAWKFPAVSIVPPLPTRVAQQSLGTAECPAWIWATWLRSVCTRSSKNKLREFREVPRCQKSSSQDCFLFSILSAKHNLCSTMFKIRPSTASQELRCCCDKPIMAVVLVTDRGIWVKFPLVHDWNLTSIEWVCLPKARPERNIHQAMGIYT